MGKWIRRIIVIIAVLAVVLEGMLQIYVAVEKKKRAEAPGNAEKYDVANLEKNSTSALEGKTIIFLGSSVTEGAAAEGQSFVELFEHQDGVQAVKEAKSGTTLVDSISIPALLAFGNGQSYADRIKKIDKEMDVDCVVCQLSTNDATMGKELGEVSGAESPEDFDTATVTGAMEYIIAYVKETWDCPVVFYTGSYYESDEYALMVGRLYELKEKWGIGIIDLYSDKEFNAIDEDAYGFYMYDEIHPTKAGYEEWWMPEMEKQLEEILK